MRFLSNLSVCQFGFFALSFKQVSEMGNKTGWENGILQVSTTQRSGRNCDLLHYIPKMPGQGTKLWDSKKCICKAKTFPFNNNGSQ